MSGSTTDSWSGGDRSPPEVPDLNLIRKVGEGRFGHVWLAANRTTGRLCAVKLIPLSGSGSVDLAGREIMSLTLMEANLRIQHPNLLTIHHVGKTSDHLFYIMDPADDVSGGRPSSDPGYQPATLKKRLVTGSLPSDDCLRCARQLLAGLACLHDEGMVHRDVKPANCLFVGGELRLADFGLLTEASQNISRVGTLPYMPPDGQMDTRADVYAAGLVIYEMVTGFPVNCFPSLGPKADELVQDNGLAALNRLAIRAGDPDRKKRFPDARQMLTELERLDTPRRRWRWRSRRSVVLSAVSAVAVLALAAVLWRGIDRSEDVRPQAVHVNFITDHYEATIWLDGTLWLQPDGTPYKTPCTIPDLPAEVHHVVFEHPDLPPLEVGPVDFARHREVEARWDAKP